MVVLIGIPRILSPELLHTLAKMGHGDEIVLADANFPSAGCCRHGPIEIRADGLAIPALLEAILQLLPLDAYDPSPVMLMDREPVDKERKLQTPIWEEYDKIVQASHGGATPVKTALIPRFDFYERAKKAFAIVHTGEAALYGNIILKKGVLP
ncbi:hypothetical protein RvY_07038 [Ramazzottius varieornatus]|uniref:L-fucose mutarotase n=1 Tax=Ramazzottius varieornatus TaxID=947166 RepID=A0A1D1V6X6_RAMVA|nr:hypothetical protein RvY_07038 [Ramazzottius varieornatus]